MAVVGSTVTSPDEPVTLGAEVVPTFEGALVAGRIVEGLSSAVAPSVGIGLS